MSAAGRAAGTVLRSRPMRTSRSLLAFAALLSLAGCTGDDPVVEPSPTSTLPPRPGEAGIEGQRIVLGEGAEIAQARLLRICDAAGCRKPSEPVRLDGKDSLSIDEPRPVLSITFEIAPDAVEARVKAKGGRRVVESLDPGTLVAWRPLVPEGRSELRIVATYGEQQLEWRCLATR